MFTDVQVTDGGWLQITFGGMVFPPLPPDAVQAAADRIPDATNVQSKQEMTDVARALTDVLAGRPDSLRATLTVTSSSLAAVVDAATFAAVQQQLGLVPDGAGAVQSGPLTVTQAT